MIKSYLFALAATIDVVDHFIAVNSARVRKRQNFFVLNFLDNNIVACELIDVNYQNPILINQCYQVFLKHCLFDSTLPITSVKP